MLWILNGPERPMHERVGMLALLGSGGNFKRQGLMEGKIWRQTLGGDCGTPEPSSPFLLSGY